MFDSIAVEQAKAYEFIERNHENDSFSHAYIVESSSYDNLEKFIYYFVSRLIDENDYKKIEDGNCPDVCFIKPDNGMIKKGQLDELQHSFLTKSVTSGKKVYVIYSADKMNDVSSNSILKFIEEPENNIYAILVVENRFCLLKTILSRCQMIKLKSVYNSKNDDVVLNIMPYVSNSNRSFNDDSYKYLKRIVDSSIKFVNYYETNRINTLLKTNEIFGEFDGREDYELFFDIIVLYYYEIIEKMAVDELKIFDYTDDVKKIIDLNTIDTISSKVRKIVSIKEKMRYNINCNLSIDRLIMLFEGRI